MTSPNGGGNTLWVPGRSGFSEVTVGQKAADLDALNRSVVSDAVPDTPQRATILPRGFFLWALAAAAEQFSPWGRAPKVRDAQIRQFWHTENMLSGAVATVAARNAALSWQVSGDERTAEAGSDLLQNANFGAGWEDFAIRVSLDLYTQDHGAFVELVRAGDTEQSPVVGIASLDAARCYPTGNPEVPVIYQDAENRYHQLKWFQVVQLLEMPAPVTPDIGGYFMRLQYSAVTRVLRAAQIIKSIGVYNEEKISGRFEQAVHLISGANADEIQDAMNRRRMQSDMAGLQRYTLPPIVTTIRPDANLKHELVELASLPAGWDEDKAFKWYINALALGFLTDYQEFAPLPGGNLGTSAQSEVLHQKSRGKGPALWQALIARLMNMHGVLPGNVEFGWDEPDVEAEQQEALVRKTRAETRQIDVQSGVLTVEAAQQSALDAGDISQEVFDTLLNGRDVTPDVTIEGEDRTGVRALTTLSPAGEIEQAKARRPVRLGELLTSRLHRAYSMTADDASALGYFDRLDDRLSVANSIGPALATFEELLREAGVWDIEIRPEDADLIFAASMKSMAEGLKQGEGEDRAGPEDARLDFEREVTEEVGKGLAAARRLLNRRLREEAEERGAREEAARNDDQQVIVKEITFPEGRVVRVTERKARPGEIAE